MCQKGTAKKGSVWVMAGDHLDPLILARMGLLGRALSPALARRVYSVKKEKCKGLNLLQPKGQQVNGPKKRPTRDGPKAKKGGPDLQEDNRPWVKIPTVPPSEHPNLH